MRNVLSSFLLISSLLISGCGYTTSSLLPSHLKTIFVKPVENKIDYMNQDDRKLYIPGLETRVRTALIDRFLFDGNLKVGDADSSDLVVETRLLSFDREDIRLTTNEDVKEYRLRITVSLKMIDKTDHDAVMWEEPSFSGEGTYLTASGSENTAVEAALKDLAQRAVARTIENW
ncbi:MAG: LptE family protein [Candidatus Omnitrophica bacterium]|nr:LptE family protein [Candidatus Omnitrophota bacterium]